MASFPGDYYHRLRLPRTASKREIKLAFRRLARQHHPDLHPNRPDAAAKFHALREAYEVLTDRVQRQRYDQQADAGVQNSAPVPPQNGSDAVNPTTAEDFYLRGIRYAIDRRYRAALGDYTEAIALHPQFLEAYLRRAEVLYLLKDDAGVLSNCQQAIYLNSTEAKTYYYQGLARYRLGYVESAIAAFTNAIACDPGDARYYYRRGIAHRDLKEIDSAAKDLRISAKLYKAQGNQNIYEQLQCLLRPMGTAGLAWPHKLWAQVSARAFRRVPGRSAPYQKVRYSSRQNTDSQSISTPIQHLETSRRNRPHHARIRQSTFRLSRPSNQYWAPGVSSRPTAQDPSQQHPARGFRKTLRLLSNPAGELLSVYHQMMSNRQVSLVGYGLAVLANLCFVLGATQYLEASSWIEASQFWAAGGIAFVAMVFVVSSIRAALRVRGLWAADIFILATATVPLGLFAVMGATADWLIPQLPTHYSSQILWVVLGMGGLWAISHSVMALNIGFSRIQTFSNKMAAWLSPIVLATGPSVGYGVWLLTSHIPLQAAS